jgi:serine/threonine protein phosphatase PrpC
MDDIATNGARHFSTRLYQLLLRAYPRAFREEYGAEMLLLFRDKYAEAVRRPGRWAVLRLWRAITGDFITSVWSQRVQSWLSGDQDGETLAGKEHIAMALQFALDVAQRTDIGRMRASNEDNLITVVPEDQQLLQSRGALFVVSDGMGGHRCGDVASELTIQTITACYYQEQQDDIPTALVAAIKQANATIYQANAAEQAKGAKDAMGATCVAAVVHEHVLYAANVGDSRVYVLHAGQLRQITRDHSLVAQMVERGELSAAAARTHEKRNLLYRALGAVAVEVDLFTEPVAAGDRIILCTDGLCAVVPDEELQAIVAQCDPAESVQQLITRANEAGGPDNVTAIVVSVAAA